MADFIVRCHQPPAGIVEHRVSAADASAVYAVLGLRPQQVLSVKPVEAGRRPDLMGLMGQLGSVRLAARQSGRANKGIGQATTVSGQAAAVTRQTWRRSHFALRLFCQELAVLLDAGIPLLEALTTLREKEPAGSATAQALAPLLAALQQGRPLSQAMADAPQHFDAVTVAIVAASERNGQLVTALLERARLLAWSEGLRDKLVGAAIYPVLLLASGLAVMGFLLLFVLPRFAGVLDGLGADLPWASRALMSFGVMVAAHPQLVAAVIGALVLAVLLAGQVPTVRQAVMGLPWHLPGLGPRLAVLALARCYRLLGMLLAAGVPMVPALDLVARGAAPRWQAALAGLRADVSAGQRLSDALDRHGLATPVARRMVRVGERSGSLALMLERAARFHDDELLRLSDVVTRAINPLLMLLMGVLIGGIVVLMYLPIFSLVDSVQ